MNQQKTQDSSARFVLYTIQMGHASEAKIPWESSPGTKCTLCSMPTKNASKITIQHSIMHLPEEGKQNDCGKTNAGAQGSFTFCNLVH